MPTPLRGEIWLARPPRALQGREQQGPRPVLVVSVDAINQGPSGLSVVVPLSRRDRGVALHVVVDPPEGGVRQHSVLLPEQIHATDQARLVERWGSVAPETLRLLEDRLRIVLDL